MNQELMKVYVGVLVLTLLTFLRTAGASAATPGLDKDSCTDASFKAGGSNFVC